MFARLLFRPDLVFFLAADDVASLAGATHDLNCISAARKGRVIYLNSSLSMEQNSQQAVRAVLLWLATQQAKAQSPASEPSAETRKDPLTEIMSEPGRLHLLVK